jgi:hypothetical protein
MKDNITTHHYVAFTHSLSSFFFFRRVALPIHVSDTAQLACG